MNKIIIYIILLLLLLFISIQSVSATTIMPLGDSITYQKNSYRTELYNKLSNDNLYFDFVGSQLTSEDTTIDKNHEGYSGKRIDYFINNIENILTINTNPDIILIHLGTNDIYQNYYISTAPQRLNQLIDKIIVLSPESYIFVGIVPQRDSGSAYRNEYDDTTDFNSAVKNTIDQKKSDKIVFVDMFNEGTLRFPTDYLSGDRLHPNPTGSSKIATVWYNHIKEYVEERTEQPPQPSSPSYNLLTNPDFELGTLPWIVFQTGSLTYTTIPCIIGNCAKLSFRSNYYGTQLYQPDIKTIEPNTRYRVNFSAYSTSGNDMEIKLKKTLRPYTDYGLDSMIDLNTEWNNYSIEFTSTVSTTVNDACFQFYFYDFAKAGDIYYIDNIVLEKMSRRTQ